MWDGWGCGVVVGDGAGMGGAGEGRGDVVMG